MSDAFNNRFISQLPAEPLQDPAPRQVHGAAYSRVQPTPVRAPQLLGWSEPLARCLGLSRPRNSAEPWLQALAGNRLLPGMQAYAMCYGGHQFGHWAGQLGDGRAIGLGELVAPDGLSWELQLKGAGPTPYSRSADGRAVLRSSLREFLCSEAMHHLGIPTTRALSLVATGEYVLRDMFYDGRPENEPGAVVCRAAPSFLRFGTYELPTSREDIGLLRQLVDYTIREHFPQHAGAEQVAVAAWFGEICERTARLMVDWMRVGFVHGVMNTDNMSIHGLTIDYGPYGWLETYDPRWTPNTTDAEGRRYSFANQPAIAQWNLACLAQALSPLVADRAALTQGLERYASVFHSTYAAAFAAKLGLGELAATDDPLLQGLFACMSQAETDYCLLFRVLSQLPLEQELRAENAAAWLEVLAPALYAPEELSGEVGQAWLAWLREYQARVRQQNAEPAQRRAGMCQVNPKYVLRNYLAQQAIEAAQLGDLSVLETLQRVLRRPYDEQPEFADYAAKRPEWARHKAGCSALSCSS